MLKSVDEIWKYFYDKISKQEKIAFISAFVWGFAAHGYMIANKLSFHDDMSAMFGLGRSIESGRWFLYIMKRIGDFFSVYVSSAWYNGICSLLFLALSAAVVVRTLEIKSEVNVVLCAGILVTFPTVAATFAYMFTAPAYCMAVLLMCMAVWTVKKNTVIGSILGGILIAVSLGIYQAYMGIFASLAVILLIKKIVVEEEILTCCMKRIAAFFCSGGIGIFVYLLMNKILGTLLGKGSVYSAPELKKIPEAVMIAYQNFFEFLRRPYFGINPYRGLRWAAVVMVLITVLLFGYRLIYSKTERKNKMIACMLGILFPLAVNFVYVITLNDVQMHSLMLYSLSCVFLLYFAISESAETQKRTGKVLAYVYTAGALVILGAFIKTDNVAYQYSSFVQEQAMTYYTNLIGRIQSCSGYSDELPVAFLNIEKIDDASITNEDRFQVSLMALGFNMKQVVSDYAYREYLKLHLGYSPIYVNEKELKIIKEKKQVQDMPCYPKEGAVKMIDHVIVVKFANE